MWVLVQTSSVSLVRDLLSSQYFRVCRCMTLTFGPWPWKSNQFFPQLGPNCAWSLIKIIYCSWIMIRWTCFLWHCVRYSSQTLTSGSGSDSVNERQNASTASATSIINSVTVLSSLPHQPDIRYDKDSDNRSFQYSWYKRWSWLDWDQQSGSVLCHPWRMINQMGMKLLSKNADPTFCTSGFCTWKDAVRRFNKHECSKAHDESVMKLQGCVKGTNVAAQVNEQVSSEQSQNRHALLQILSTLKFLCRQGLPIRGHEHSRVGKFYPHVVLTTVKTPVKTGLGKTPKTHFSWAKLIFWIQEC